MKKWQKVTAVTTASAMTMQLAACGVEETTVPYEETYESTVVETVMTEEPTNTAPVTGEMYDEDGELIDIYDSDYAEACDEWYEDEDGSYVCEDENSPYYQNHFFDGLMYATIGAMVASSYYKNKNKVNGTYYKKEDLSSTGSSSSSGSSYSGGASSSSKNNVDITKPSTSNSTTNSTTNNTTTNPAGSSKPSNGASTYSSGKSGFSSGGTSRGGSSSS